MSTLPETIRAIRVRLKHNMSEFAQLIGTDQSTVSRYESGQVVPSKTTLILLALLAQGEERRAILEGLGDVDEALLNSRFAEAQENLKTTMRSRNQGVKQASKRSRVAFAEEAAALLQSDTEIAPSVVAMLKLFRQNPDNPKLAQTLAEMIPYFEFVAQRSANRRR